MTLDDLIPPTASPEAKVPVASPASPAPGKEPEASAPESVAPSEASEADKPTDEQKDEKARRPIGPRLAELTAKWREAEARAEAALRRERQAMDLVQRISEPQRPDASFDEQEARRYRQATAVDRAELARDDSSSAYTDMRNARAEKFQAQVDAVRDRLPDFDEVFHSMVGIDEPLAAILATSDRAPDVVYHLGKNPSEMARISRLPPHLKGAEIARLEARLATPTRKSSNTPPPVPRVGGGSAPSAKSPSSMSMTEFEAAFGKALRQR
jgi:hypothetical protein